MINTMKLRSLISLVKTWMSGMEYTYFSHSARKMKDALHHIFVQSSTCTSVNSLQVRPL